ncbi:MAG: hypothetical protein V2I97_11530 [Desulfococcaceae bacterium]|jgi:hypothetical protein|nr:hypothetical protein [Desulfococcaceae bacterium]
MNFFNKLFDKFSSVAGDENIRVIDGHVFFSSDFENSQSVKPKKLGAYLFQGFQSKGVPGFVVAKIEPRQSFFHFRTDRFFDGVYQKKIIPSVAVDEPLNPDFSDGTADPVLHDIPGSLSEPVFHLPAKFPASFLVENLTSDLGGFLDFLKNGKYSRETLACYSLDIRLWNQKLEGCLSAEKIKDILHLFKSPTRRSRMLSALKTYGKYRLLYGDHRVTVILSTSHDIKNTIQSPKPKKILPKEITQTYLLQAENLCRTGDRTGIWMALCLYGFKPSEFPRIKLIETSGNRMNQLEVRRRGGNIHNIAVPAWLYKAVSELPKKKVGADRRTIHKGLRCYGTFPTQLYNALADNDLLRSGKRTGNANKHRPEAAAGGY